MNLALVFAASFLGSILGVLAAVVPVIIFVKKKWENSPMGAMLG